MAQQGNLQRVIIEVTNRCNLDCSICLRQSWKSDPGNITTETFSKFTTHLHKFHFPPEIFFGGYGEPLSHPNILDMISKTASLGSRTSLITNGILLNSPLVDELVKAGLKKLWISVDSFHQDAFHRSQFKDQQSSIFDILAEILASENGKFTALNPGLSFVCTRHNQVEILELLIQGWNLGLRSFFITNLEAYTPTQAAHNPYSQEQLRRPGSWRKIACALLEQINNLKVIDPRVSVEGVLNHHQEICPFVERGDLVLRRDGEISPCLPLLYNRTTYIDSWEHKQYAYSLGNIRDVPLDKVWTGNNYSQLRKRLLNQDFSPCLTCRDCWLSEDNRQDCMGFEHPTCGGCLWAAGLISCP